MRPHIGGGPLHAVSHAAFRRTYSDIAIVRLALASRGSVITSPEGSIPRESRNAAGRCVSMQPRNHVARTWSPSIFQPAAVNVTGGAAFHIPF